MCSAKSGEARAAVHAMDLRSRDEIARQTNVFGVTPKRQRLRKRRNHRTRSTLIQKPNYGGSQLASTIKETERTGAAHEYGLACAPASFLRNQAFCLTLDCMGY